MSSLTPGLSPAELILGVDGSGSTTQALVADTTGRMLGRGLGPSADQHKVGFEKMCEGLTTAIEGAIGQVVGLGGGERPSWKRVKIAAACFGLAGIDRPEDQVRVSEWARSQGISSNITVVNDSELILAAGTAEGWGIALISGAGSICLGRTRDGRTARAGGWGHLIGDEGSGYQIAVDALRLATQAADGRSDATRVLQAVLSYWRLKEPQELIGHVYRSEVTAYEISELAIPIIDLAARGDGHARQIVESAARALARHVDTVVRKLNLATPPVALSGAALRATLRKMLMDALTVEVGPVSTVQDPAQGAVTVALRRRTAAVS